MDKWHWAIVGGAVGAGLLLYATSPARGGEMTEQACEVQTHMPKDACNTALNELVAQLTADEAPPKLSEECSDMVIGAFHGLVWSGTPPHEAQYATMHVMASCAPPIKPTGYST